LPGLPEEEPAPGAPVVSGALDFSTSLPHPDPVVTTRHDDVTGVALCVAAFGIA